MSVINQVLIDLEKRRASSAERGVVPNHVRALPEGERQPRWGWIAVGGLVAVAAIAGAWALLSGFELPGWRAPAPIAPLSTETAIEKVVASSAGVEENAQPGEQSQIGQLASRLSFELSNPPEVASPPPADAGTPRAPLPAARVLGRASGEPATRSEPAVAREELVAPARPEKTKAPAVVAAARPSAGAPPDKPEIKKQVRQPTPREQAENEFRKAVASLHQGRLAEAQEGFQAALDLYPGYHGARQALVGLLLEGRKPGDAERVLQEGVRLAPAQIGFATTLARLQVDRGDNATAIATLQKGLDYAQGSPDYLAFLAALLQRAQRHHEAIEQFQAALRLRPAAGVWLLGLGLSLQTINRTAQAQDAYQRAKATGSLNPELTAFADQRLRQLQ
ncbi:MAG: hypothetical protein HYS46_06275 [Betaproteobacteria bacterium]|nr:hypothetical protein [Betaproteobacteria bacterium]